MSASLEIVDHIHVFVSDRVEAERWYGRVLGFKRVSTLEQWATDEGPLTIASVGGGVHLALFERGAQPHRATIALRAKGQQFLDWHEHLTEHDIGPVRMVDHELAWSLYFADPDGNPYEIVSYDYEWLAARIVGSTARAH